MCRINRLKSPYGLFIFICAMCLLSVFSSVAAGATLADLAGTWNFNSFVTGPGAPWWVSHTEDKAGRKIQWFLNRSDGQVNNT